MRGANHPSPLSLCFARLCALVDSFPRLLTRSFARFHSLDRPFVRSLRLKSEWLPRRLVSLTCCRRLTCLNEKLYFDFESIVFLFDIHFVGDSLCESSVYSRYPLPLSTVTEKERRLLIVSIKKYESKRISNLIKTTS